MRCLIVEDDRSVASALQQVLTDHGHRVTCVGTGADLLLRHRDAEVVLLDLGLPDEDGMEVLRKLRQVDDVPVLVVTARGDERSIVRGLHLGADDYVVKPVRLQELLARINAVARRRTRPTGVAEIVIAGDVRIDLGARAVTCAGQTIALTTKEFDLLAALARRVGSALSRQQILDEVWGDAFGAASRSFDVHLGQVRAKLRHAAVITTIRGFGYRLES